MVRREPHQLSAQRCPRHLRKSRLASEGVRKETEVCLGGKRRLAEARWDRPNQGDWAVFSGFWGSLKNLKDEGYCLPGLFECHLPVTQRQKSTMQRSHKVDGKLDVWCVLFERP